MSFLSIEASASKGWTILSGKKKISFEKSMLRLEEIVASLETGELGLEQGMTLYREGMACAKLCRDELEKARHELEIWQAGMNRSADVEDFLEDDSPHGEE